MSTKLLFTHENFEQINGVLSDYGFESDVKVYAGGRKLGNVSQNRDFVNIGYHGKLGFYVATSGKHIYNDADLEQYQAELSEAAHVIGYLNKNIKEKRDSL